MEIIKHYYIITHWLDATPSLPAWLREGEEEGIKMHKIQVVQYTYIERIQYDIMSMVKSTI